MKIWNIKINIQNLIWILLLILLLFAIIYFICMNTTIHMNHNNFTTILRDSHQNMSQYIGKRITTSGYVFRNKDFEKNYFVIARDMLINETQAHIVGFLCSYDNADDFENNEWVEATGIITLGDYFGPIPMIKIETIKKITTPNDIFVNPPK